MKKNVLYLTYNGLNEPLGRSQILPYIKLINNEYKLNVISFENNLTSNDSDFLNKDLNKLDINWIVYKRYKNKLILNIFSFLKAFFYVFYLVVNKKINIIHARSFIPASLSILVKIFLRKVKIIYDIRGFWIDEKVDRLNFKKGFVYYVLKKIDEYNYYYSDHIIFLTHNSFNIINEKYFKSKLTNYSIIPTCADKNIFYPIKKTNKNKIINLCYMGSISKAYDFIKILKYFSQIINLNPNFRLVIINKGDHYEILEKLNLYKIPKEKYELISLNRNDLNKKLNEIDLGIFYANKNYSIQASYPTRIGEFLMAGKAIICNNFNSDINNLTKQNFIYNTNFEIKDVKLEISKIINFISKIKINQIREYALQNLSNENARLELLNIYNKLSL